jgi:hypothetical protein
MRKSVVLTIAGGVVAATMMSSFIAANRPANAATLNQCINGGTSCLTKCGVGSVPEEMVQGCADSCRRAEWNCIKKSSDAGDAAHKARDRRNKQKNSGGNKVPPKGGKSGQEVVVDPVRPPKTPGGEQPPAKSPQSTGTWTPPSQTPPPPASTVKDPRTTPPGWVKPSFGAGAYRP